MCAALASALASALAQTTPARTSATENEKKENEVLELSPFIVTAESDGGYSGKQTLIGSRFKKDLIEIPSNIAIINKELLANLDVRNISQAVRFGVSGVTQNAVVNDDYNIRGFRTEQSMRNGVTKNANRSNPMYDVSRVEVIKGPAAMLLGNNSFLGGAINLVSDQPSNIRATHIQATMGDNGFFRGVATTSGPLLNSADMRVNYRFTVGGLVGDREKEVESMKQKFIGGAFSIYMGSSSSLLVNAYYFRDRGYLYNNDFLDITSKTVARLNQYSTKSFSPSQAKHNKWDGEDGYIDLQYATKVSENANVRLYYTASAIREHRRHIYGNAVLADNYTMPRNDIPFFIEKNSHNVQIDFLHHLDQNFFKVDSTLGADGSITHSLQQLAVNAAPPLDTRNPNWAADDAYYAQQLPGAGLPITSDTLNRPIVYSYYFQENLSFWKDRIILVGGLRWFEPGGTTVNGITKVVTNRNPQHFRVHKYGVVVKVLPDVSVYYTDAANVFVQTGFADLVVAGDQKGAPAGNQEGTLREFGIKANHKLSENVTMYGTVAHFEMSLTNIKTVGFLPSGNPGQIISAMDKSNGWEVDYGARLGFAGGGHVDLIYTYFNGDSSTAANPLLQAVDFAPRKYSILLKCTWTSGPAKGLMLGGGVMDQTAKRNLLYSVDFPLTASLFAGYEYKGWEFQANVDNVTNQRYIVNVSSNGAVGVADLIRPRLAIRRRW